MVTHSSTEIDDLRSSITTASGQERYYCPTCWGDGKVKDHYQVMKCPDCDGTGIEPDLTTASGEAGCGTPGCSDPNCQYGKQDDAALAAARSPGVAATPTIPTEVADLRRYVIELREWKAAIIDKCKASDGFDQLEWGGDKEGWGFVHYFIGHLETRALHAESVLAEQDARHAAQAGRNLLPIEPTPEMISAGMGEIPEDGAEYEHVEAAYRAMVAAAPPSAPARKAACDGQMQLAMAEIERLEALNLALPSTEHQPGCQSGDFGPCDCSLSSPTRQTGDQ